jgi:hypothetical protein
MTTEQHVIGGTPPCTVRDQLRVRLTLAETLATNPTVQQLLTAAQADLSALLTAQLVRCAHCYRRGLPERIALHDCPTHSMSHR